jgi:tetratricopeptide (TPR) repeat protein
MLASSLDVLRSIVRKELRNVGPVALLNARGYRWLIRRYLPALEHLERVAKTREHRRLVADAFYTLGDLHDFNEAPLAAIQAYQRCLALDPKAGGAWREFGGMLASIGEFDEARRALRRALRCNPKDGWARDDLEWLEESPPAQHQYRAGDPCWQACELLAQQRPREALDRLRGRRSVRPRLVRLRALGALGQNESALQEWRELARSRGPIRLNYGDWFFLPASLHEDPRLWEALDALAERLEPGVFELPESLTRATARSRDPHPSKPPKGASAEVRRVIEYQIARLRQDLRAAKRASANCPGWSAAAALVTRRESRSATA